MRTDATEYKRDAIRATLAVAVLSMIYKAMEPIFNSISNADHINHARNFAEQSQHFLTMSMQDKSVQSRIQHI